MSSVQDIIVSVIEELVRNNELFTALDVSNRVKATHASARHREVRDIVRSMWDADIQPFSYAKTPIDVNLSDGTVVQAMLYHPLADSWDLDTKYDAQKRNQSSKQQAVAVPVPTPNTIPATSINPWGQMFGTQPSLFPRR
jgi:hypothetical protein